MYPNLTFKKCEVTLPARVDFQYVIYIYILSAAIFYSP